MSAHHLFTVPKNEPPLFLFYHGTSTTTGRGKEGFSKHGDDGFPSFVIEYSPEGLIQYNHHQE
jgi:hypothetical protein